MKKICILLIAVLPFLYSCSPFYAGAETLSLAQCIKIAIESHPDIKTAKASLNIANSSVWKAASSFYPQVSASSSYSHSEIIEPVSSSSDNYSAGISASQNICDFGKRGGSFGKALEDKNTSNLALQEKISEVILSVTRQYYEYLKAKRIAETDSESLGQSEEHLAQAKDFYKAGTKSKIDVTKAEVQRANDKLSLISALNFLKIAKLKLGNAMGMKQADFEVEDMVDTKTFDISFEECMQRAFKSRPDMLEMESKVKSARLSIAIATSSFLPSISASGSYNYSGTEFPPDWDWDNESWEARVSLSIPIFTGFSTLSNVKIAQENLNIAMEQKRSYELSVQLEVEQAYLTVQEKKESIEAAAEGLRNAEENFSLAQGRYLSGIGSMIELADAQVSLTSAKTNYINSLYNYVTSVASLKKAAGMQ